MLFRLDGFGVKAALESLADPGGLNGDAGERDEVLDVLFVAIATARSVAFRG